MYHNLVEKVITKYWRNKFGNVLGILRNNFYVVLKHHKIHNASLMHYRIVLKTKAYFLVRDYKINNRNKEYDSITNYSQDCSFTKYLREFVHRTGYKYSDGYGKYNWLLEGYWKNVNKDNTIFTLKSTVSILNMLRRDLRTLQSYENFGELRNRDNLIDLFQL